MIRPHVGTRVSALVDGQLPPAESDRLWAHVMGCRSCRQAVEHEGWVKTQLAGLSASWPTTPPLGLAAADADRWSADRAAQHPPALPGPERRTARTIAAIGAGSIGAAMVGVLALGVSADPPERRAPVTTSLNQSTTAVPAGVRPTP